MPTPTDNAAPAEGADAVADVQVETPAVDTPEVEAAVETADEPQSISLDEFGWDDWDGGADSLPEVHRDWAARAMEWVQNRHADEAAQLERLKASYEAWERGIEDPRIKELEQSLKDKDLSHAELRREIEAAKQELETERKAVQEYFEAERDRLASKFRKDNEWIFDGGKIEETASALLDEGWPLGALPSVLKLEGDQLELARSKFGNHPDLDSSMSEDRAALVLEIVGEPKPTKKPKRIASDFVSGSDGTPTSTPAVEADSQPTTLKELKLSAVRRSMRKAGRRT